MSLFDLIKIEEKVIEKEVKSNFVFNHLPFNLGITLGNYLRRAILDYVGTVSLCGVCLSDKNGPIKTKFSSLVGLDKTAFFLVLSLREIVFVEEEVMETNQLFEFNLEVKSKEEEIIIRAGDFVSSHEKIIIKNTELVLGVLAPNSFLQIVLYCRKGVGYVPEKKQEVFFNKEEKENVIVLDSNYSPVENVFPLGEKIVTGLIDQEEKLVLEIKTNGAVTPKRVLESALNVTINLFEELKKKVNFK